MSVRADVETFRSVPIFSECDAVHLQLLAFSAVRQTFEAGGVLFRQGTSGAAAYLVLSGDVRLSTEEAGPIGTAGPGAMLGEVAMIGDRPYSITATAWESVSVVRVDRELFMRVAQEFPAFSRAVFDVLARRLETSMSELEATKLHFDSARSFKSL